MRIFVCIHGRDVVGIADLVAASAVAQYRDG
jgi:hypothetical protein